MSGFSPQWLALREPADHRSRDRHLAQRLVRHFEARERVTVVDLGCGTGSNIRATSTLLRPEQHWTLVDFDAALLAAARDRLTAWADRHTWQDDELMLAKGSKLMAVRFRQANLATDLEAVLGEKPDLVTASALFDLCSVAFIERFAKAVAERKAAFYTVLTYNGAQTWTPPHAADAEMAAAFQAHQTTDKGFGISAGATAPAVLAKAFRDQGAEVHDGDSPWTLGKLEQPLLDQLAKGFADAAGETGTVGAERIKAWRAARRTGATVGHTDTLALPQG